MHISKDKCSIRVKIDQAMTTEQLETLISDLAEFRAGMEPPVPIERPTSADQRVSMQDEPSLLAIPLKDGRIRFWLRNHGIGWLVYNFTIQQAITLREFLNSNTPESDGKPNLFHNNGTDSGPAH